MDINIGLAKIIESFPDITRQDFLNRATAWGVIEMHATEYWDRHVSVRLSGTVRLSKNPDAEDMAMFKSEIADMLKSIYQQQPSAQLLSIELGLNGNDFAEDKVTYQFKFKT